MVNMITHAQQGKLSFEGVYTLESPPALLILKSAEDGFIGYISDGNTAYKVKGENNSDYLRLTMVDSPDKAANYLALDELGNLWVTDDQLKVIYFTRSTELAEELITSIEKQQLSEKMEGKSKSGNSTIIKSSSTNSGKYANKKFLHLYADDIQSEKWAYYLFEHGGFYFKSSNSYMSKNAYTDLSTIFSSNDAGKWNIETRAGVDYLELSWNTGEHLSLQIKKAELGYLLNGVKYYLVGLDEYE
jgi:hypothetical protein